MDRKKDIIKIIDSMAGRYSAYEVFTDWTKCSALAISNSLAMIHDKVWQRREDEYRATIQKYNDKEREKLVEMFDLLVETLEGTMADVLGQIYMESGMGSKAAGQFFTPYHLSQECANLALLEPDEHGIYRVSEPSCGGGGMIIAIAERMRDQGIDYQRKLQVVAQDLDWKGVYMCYLQLSLLGIKAICVQGDTLHAPYDPRKTEKSHMLITPGQMGVLI